MSNTADSHSSLPLLLLDSSTLLLPLPVLPLCFAEAPSLLPGKSRGSRGFEDLNLDGRTGVKNEDSVDQECVPGLGLDLQQISGEQSEASWRIV